MREKAVSNTSQSIVIPGSNPIPFNLDWNKLGRARRDYFKNSVRSYVQDVFDQIEGVLAA